MEDQVLAGNPGTPFPVIDELHRLGHLEPELARHHRRGQIGAPDPGGEGPDRPVRAGVAVGAGDEIPGTHDPLLREERMLDPRFADIVIVGEPLFEGEVPHELALLGRSDVLVRGEVVRDEDYLLAVEHLASPRLPECIDGDRRRDVVSEGDIDPRIDQHPGTDLVEARMPAEYLFRDGH